MFYIRFDALLIGFFISSNESFKRFLKSIFEKNYSLIIFIFLIGFIFSGILILMGYMRDGLLASIALLLTNFICGILVYSFSFLPKLDCLKSLAFLAQISYPFYLVHHTVIKSCSGIVRATPLNIIIFTLVTFGISIFISYLLHRIIENPLMKYRNKFIPQN